jgi:hypothetical protein
MALPDLVGPLEVTDPFSSFSNVHPEISQSLNCAEDKCAAPPNAWELTSSVPQAPDTLDAAIALQPEITQCSNSAEEPTTRIAPPNARGRK